jgi:hypothetical protein
MRAGRARSSVLVTGSGVVGPAGALGQSRILELLERRSIGACPDVDLDSLGVDPRRLDPSSRWLTAAAALALSSGPRESVARMGLFVVGARMPEQSSRRCIESIRQRGFTGMSGAAFARMSLNSPTGSCARALGLLGPTSTLSSGNSSGLLAVVLAAEWLAWRDDAAGLVAGGVGELSPLTSDEAEGAACLALRRSAAARAGAVVAAGWAIAGPDGAEEAADHAMIGLSPVDGVIVDGEARIVKALHKWSAAQSTLGVIEATRLWGASEAVRSSVMAAVAAAIITAGRAKSALIVSARGASSVALVLERGQS